MALRDQILADIKTAMKDRNEIALNALRFLNSSIKNREIELRPNPLTDAEVINVLKKSVKQRAESIEQFEKAGRTDLSDKEKAEMAILEKYLPKSLSRDQIEKVVTEVIAALQATSVKQMGAVIKEVAAKTAGAADNKTVSEIVKAKLS